MKDIHAFNSKRKKLNNLLEKHDEFFDWFQKLDNDAYSEGEIPKKYKELTGLSISVFSRCDECIAYHIQTCLKEKSSKKEMIEAIRIGVIGGGSVTYPNARYAFSILKELRVLK